MSAHLYLSPHLDDAVFSCGGLMALQDAAGEAVSVMTLFAGDPPDWSISPLAAQLHARWGKPGPPIAVRRAEDRVACGRLGSSVIHLGFPDAIYRKDESGQPLYASDEALFGPVAPQEASLVEALEAALREAQIGRATVYCPMGIGGHVDHRLTRRAAERLKVPLTYYREFPYAARGGEIPLEMSPPEGKKHIVALSEEALQAWVQAAAEYRTQLSTFWDEAQAMAEELRLFHDASGGIVLLKSGRRES